MVLFFFNDTATTEIYTLSLHDALPISRQGPPGATVSAGLRRGARTLRSPRPRERADRAASRARPAPARRGCGPDSRARDRKSTRLNSSHANISYAVFCLKKKKIKQQTS